MCVRGMRAGEVCGVCVRGGCVQGMCAGDACRGCVPGMRAGDACRGARSTQHQLSLRTMAVTFVGAGAGAMTHPACPCWCRCQCPIPPASPDAGGRDRGGGPVSAAHHHTFFRCARQWPRHPSRDNAGHYCCDFGRGREAQPTDATCGGLHRRGPQNMGRGSPAVDRPP